MLVIMGAVGYGGAYLYMQKQILQREVEIQILHMYIEKEVHNERKRKLRV